MIYTTGTIAVSGNTLTGTGTNFTAAGSLIRNGCTIIALTSPAQVFQITAIGGATGLTVTPAANPAIPAGTKYSILLSDSLSVDGLAQDIAETFMMYQRYMGNFADVMNSTTDVNIQIDGVSVRVPGQKSLAKKGENNDITSLSGLTTALSIDQGGTGAKTVEEMRAAFGWEDDVLPVELGGTGAKTVEEMRAAFGWEDDVLPVELGGTGAKTVEEMRAALSVYSSTEMDTKISAVEARLGYALITPPGNIALGARLTYPNPFGAGVPCIVLAEFYQSTSGEWISTDAYGNADFYAGVRAYFTSNGIMLVVGSGAFQGRINAFPFSGSATLTANWITPSPVRIHCWKVAA